MTDDHRFVVTFFADEFAQDLTEKEMNLAELRDLVLTTTARQKTALPWLKLANFGTERNAESQSLRHNANVTSITGIEGDYDAKEMAFDRAVELLNQARLKGLVYTSPSYAPSAPKWRVILPTSMDLEPSERKKLVARVNGVLGGVLADESFTLSQAYYLGSVNGNPDHRAVITEGNYIDLRDDLDATARGKRSATAGAEQPRRDAPRTDKQADPDLIFAAMAVIPNGDDVEWPAWNELGMASWLSTNAHERGLEAFLMWSSKSSKHNEANTRERWQRYFASPPTEIGAGTIFQKADQAQPGWRALAGLPIDKVTEILRLAKLPLPQYDIERKEASKHLGFTRIATLDDIVGQLRTRMTLNDADDDKQGTRFIFANFEPWPDAVDGETLIADMTRTVRNHVILAPHQALATSLWTIHAHALEVSDHTPRFQIKSPTMRCGKTTLLSTVAAMVPKGLATQNISTSALFRIIEMTQPTLLIDEADNFFKNSDGSDNKDTLGILNSGHTRNGWFIRTVGEDFEPRAFRTFAPIAFAWLVKRGIQVDPTLEDRSITVELRRRLPGEKVERLRSTRTGHLHQLGRRAARWVADNKSSLVDADPLMPEELNDRAQDNWRPLIAIADAISADLGRNARDAAKKIEQEKIGGDDDAGTLALADVAAIIKTKLMGQPPKSMKGIGSQDLVRALVAMTDRPWKEWKRGSPLTEHSLAKLLKPFMLFAKKIRIGGVPTQGYVPAKVLEVAERYVKEEEEEVEEEADEDGSVDPM
jgi:hypothetical protein